MHLDAVYRREDATRMLRNALESEVATFDSVPPSLHVYEATAVYTTYMPEKSYIANILNGSARHGVDVKLFIGWITGIL